MEPNNTQQPLNDSGHVDTRDFRAKTITLINSSGGAKDITTMIAEVQVRQDLYLGFMSGELLITDGVDLHSQMSMHGGEYIFIHLTVPEQSIEIRKAFRVYKVGNRKPLDNAQQYSIYFVSDELFKSYTTKINQAYTNMTISGIALEIMKTHLKIPTDKIFVDPTTGSTSVIIPNWRPLEALNWLATRAYNTDMDTFFFYENLEGFHFRSLHSIYKDPRKIKVPFTFENKRGSKSMDMDKFAIDVMESKRDFDILSTVAGGGYAMSLTTIDPITQGYVKNELGADQMKGMYQSPSMSNADNLFRKSDTHKLVYLKTNGIEDWIRRVMKLATLNNSMVELAVPGNMGLEAGTIIGLRVPYTIPPASGDMWDKRKSGKYLVIAVNHKFDMMNHRFNSMIALARDSFPEGLPAEDSKLPEKIKKLTQ
jgi:hypothetical protein